MDNGGDFTDRLIAEAGIAPGAQVLDVGCGRGAVSFRLAEAVGREGSVLGIDPDGAALEAASLEAERRRLTNVTFRQSDLLDFGRSVHRFDVIACRRVLMYLPDQTAGVAAFRTLLNPGGTLIMQEHDASVLFSSQPMPVYERARGWVWDTVRSEGGNTRTGFDLHSLLSAVGFTDTRITAEVVLETPDTPSALADIVRVMLPRIERAGVATAAQADVDTLAERLRRERRETGATSVGEMIFGAVARAP